MTASLRFAAGWAMPASFWQPVRERLPSKHHASAPRAGPVVAIGHSLGVLRLLLEPPERLAGVVSINGFSRFCRAPGHEAGTDPRLLQRMVRRLQQDADATVGEFRARSGLDRAHEEREPLDLAELAEGLRLLREADGRAALAGLSCPILALASLDDAIVPPALTRACFSGLARVPGGKPALRWVGQGGHVLPVTDPRACASAILDLLAAIG